MSKPYETKAVETTGMPPGIPYIVGNEAAERFCFYGMKAVLVLFMTKYMVDASGNLATLPEAKAREYFHYFIQAVYFLPLLGAVISDGLLGKYRTILFLSVIYTLGPLVLAFFPTQTGALVGLGLIALGSGGIKPCVSAHVGDQFGTANQHLVSKAFQWFYFSVNFGSTFSTVLIPYMLSHHGPRYAFAIPAVLMCLATIIFWMGRHKFIHVPPTGMEFVRETISPKSLAALGRMGVIYAFVAVFWSLWDQTSSAWVLQATKMDLNVFGITVDPGQVQALNPLLIVILIPAFQIVIYPLIEKIVPLTPLRKLGMGLFLTIPSFLIPAWVEHLITLGQRPGVWWHLVGFIIISAAEIMVSITVLEFAYTQAPKRMKSLVMSIYLLSISMGNLFTALVNRFIQNKDGTVKLVGADYYLFFAAVMTVAAVSFVFYARNYKGESQLQDAAAPQPS